MNNPRTAPSEANENWNSASTMLECSTERERLKWREDVRMWVLLRKSGVKWVLLQNWKMKEEKEKKNKRRKRKEGIKVKQK